MSFLLLIQFLNGQNTLNKKNISYGHDYQGFSKALKKYFTIDDVLLSVCLYRETIILQTFSKDSLNCINSKDYRGFPKNVQVEDVVEFNNHVYLFYSTLVHDDSLFEEKLYLKEINVDSCRFEKTKLLMKVDGNVTAILSMQDYDNFDFCSSLDQDRFMVQYKKKKKMKQPVELGYKIFDRDFNLVWEKEIEMPYNGFQMENIDFAIDAQSNVYLASYIFRNKVSNLFRDNKGPARRVTERGAINYDLEIFKIGIKTGNFTKSKIVLDSGYHINSFKFFPINNEQLIGAGYSSVVGRNDKFHQTSGVFKFNLLDKERKIDMLPIPTDLVNQNLKKSKVALNTSLSRRYGKYFKPVLKDLVPENMILEKDGGMILIGEQQIPIERHYVVPGPGVIVYSSTQHMLYNDVLISKFNTDGSSAWMKKLAKRQETTNRIDFFGLQKRGLSFKLVEGEKDLYLLYVDQFKNLKLPSDKKPAELNDDGNHGFLTAYKINRTTGAASKAAILDVQQIRGLRTNNFNISGINTFQKDQFLFEGYYNNEDMSEAHLRLTNVLGFLTLVNLK
ncbi:MAG: hypothetical protein JKX68_05805 [Flavobacteriales bacterium]|nr:hypothetical protein [Flavobacteriales bacterium]